MPSRPTIDLRLVKVTDQLSRRNFDELARALRELCGVVVGRETGDVTLVAGANLITPAVPRPRGRITVYQSAAADLFDTGLNDDGKWGVTASAGCTCRFIFF